MNYRNLNHMEVNGVTVEPGSLWTLTDGRMVLADDDQYLALETWNPNDFEKMED